MIDFSHVVVMNGPLLFPTAPPALQTDPVALARLADHKAILEAHGIPDIGALGALSFSATVVPQPGMVHAPLAAAAAASTWTTSDLVVAGAHRIVPPPQPNGSATVTSVSGAAKAIAGVPLAGHDASLERIDTSVPIPINTAYWVADTIDLAAGTTIVLQSNVRFLVIIANSITVGAGVAITYDEFPPSGASSPPGKPPAPQSWPATPNPFTEGLVGYEGSAGVQPMQPQAPPQAPNVELWTLAINVLPTVYLKGQRGYTGTRGGDGADGGRGGDGSESQPDPRFPRFNCANGPGNGGAGGKGGRGGTGGAGGNGGTGGRWALFTTAPVMTALTAQGFYVDVSGGNGGPGGPPGAPGNGGGGGNRGGIHGVCANSDWSSRTNGNTGPAGDAGNAGPAGAPGAPAGADATRFVAINSTDFLNKLTDPLISTVVPSNVNVGATITISGVRFTPTDLVTVGGIATPLIWISSSMVQCAVPNTIGGLSNVQITRADGTHASNLGTLFISPVVTSTIPPSPSTRLMPGTTVRVVGSGFTPQSVVRINNTDAATTTFIDSQNLDFTMTRPTSVPYDPAHADGEPAQLSVAISGPVLVSNAIPIIIATYHILVLGDSVAWGEGLQEQNKYHTLVGAHVALANAGISVYKTVRAHCGAIVGWNDGGSDAGLPGDVSDSYPTLKQQAESYASSADPAKVNLIVLTGGANDVGFSHFLDPAVTHPQIHTRVTQYCDSEMTAFLTWLGATYPAAKIVVTGYYPGLSTESLALNLAHPISRDVAVMIVAVLYGTKDHQGLLPKAFAVLRGLDETSVVASVSNATYFAEQANLALATAVGKANAAAGGSRFAFADPKFTTHNAALAGDPWVFGLNKIRNIFEPTDSLAAANARASVCQNCYSGPHQAADREFCRLSSAGHPNETGAQHYANAIIAVL